MDNQLPPLPSDSQNNRQENTNVSVVNNAAAASSSKIGQNAVKFFILFLIIVSMFYFLGWMGIGLVNKLIKNSNIPNQALKISSGASTKQRQSDVNTIVQAIKLYYISNNDKLPPEITSSKQVIETNGANLCAALLPKYLTLFPVDPKIYNGQPLSTCQYNYQTGYDAQLQTTGGKNKVVISAPMENGKQINASFEL